MRLIIRWAPPTWNFEFASAATAWQDRLRCALLGHEDVITVAGGVVALQCRRCRWRSSGWHLDCGLEKRSRPREEADTAALVVEGARRDADAILAALRRIN